MKVNVYFVNCLLACIIAYGAGYWFGKRATERRLSAVLSRARWWRKRGDCAG
jgi:membrane protein DedA with SNARE-associated domain